MAVTLVDSLDTLWIMGLHDEFDQATEWISKSLNVRLMNGGTTSLYTYNIYVGIPIYVCIFLCIPHYFVNAILVLASARDGDCVRDHHSESRGVVVCVQPLQKQSKLSSVITYYFRTKSEETPTKDALPHNCSHSHY